MNKKHLPTRKVTAGMLSGALTTLVVTVVHQTTSVKIDATSALAIGTVLTFLVQYFVRD